MSNLQVIPSSEKYISKKKEVDRAANVRNQLVELKTTIERSFLTMGAYMKEVRDQRYYLLYGYSNLEDFCKKEIGYGSRQVRNFVAVYEKFIEELGIEQDLLITVGSTKLIEMSRVTTSENVGDLITYALKNSTMNVRNRVCEILGNEGLDQTDEKNGDYLLWQVKVTPSQMHFFNQAIEAIKRANGSEWDALAIEHAFADCLAGLGQTDDCLSFFMEKEDKEKIDNGLAWAQSKGYPAVGVFFAEAVSAFTGQSFQKDDSIGDD